MMRFAEWTLALLMVFCIAVSSPAQSGMGDGNQLQAVDQVLQKYVEALGGHEAITGLGTRICKGTEITDLRSRQEPIYEEHWLKAYGRSPGKHLTVIGTDSGNEYTGCNGEMGWVRDKCGVRKAEDVLYSKLGYVLDPQAPLWINDYFHGLTMKEPEELNGRTVYVLVPSDLEEAHYALFFDTETGLLVRIGYYWDLLDYREVDGVMFPHKIAASRKGGSTTYEFDEVTHNEEIPDSMFAMPQEP